MRRLMGLMSGPVVAVLFLLPFASSVGESSSGSTFHEAGAPLSFGDRVEAQRAIERVRHAHRTDAPEPFEMLVTDELLEAKVARYLRQSVALDRRWHHPLTARALASETARMMRGSRMPGRLRELFAALGDDPVLIQECLVRPVLADRLARRFFAADAQAPHRTWDEWWLETRAEFDPAEARTVADAWTLHARTNFDRWLYTADSTEADPPSRDDFADDTWQNASLDDVPEGRTDHVAVWTGSEMIVWGGGDYNELIYQNAGWRYDPATDSWLRLASLDAPTARRLHVAVWTGSEMIVWGGSDDASSFTVTGGRYDPVSDSWSATSTAGAPAPRQDATAVWTGEEMIVWGGWNGTNNLNSGGRYDPDTDAWQPTSTVNAPTARYHHAFVWTGTEMIVWGGWSDGTYLNTGGRYDPDADSWSPTSTLGAPSTRMYATGIWTGEEMIVWGGYRQVPLPDALGDGAKYDPDTDSWSPISSAGAPFERLRHEAIWTGEEMIVWGGRDPVSTWYDTGGRYDPASDSWTPTSTEGAPSVRSRHTMVWTGEETIVWGGQSQVVGKHYTGGRYDPQTDSWTPTSDTWGPARRYWHVAVWTGNEMIIWGGTPTSSIGDAAWRYDPALDAWSESTTIDAPEVRTRATSIWTGSEMIVWGGGSSVTYDTGGRYDPVADRWQPTSLVGAPQARGEHTAVWTGSEMIVWGGKWDDLGENDTYLQSGGRYDPAMDSWQATSLQDAPEARKGHVAAWTGSEMIVWGGNYRVWTGPSSVEEYWVDTGGRYDPATDSWTPTTTVGAPSPRQSHVGVWTGEEMIVWGGEEEETRDGLDTGGTYDPVADSWTPTTLEGAPLPRQDHTAVWTGSEMVVWGGDFVNRDESGGRYDPQADSWRATTVFDAPDRRGSHTAVWAGDRMYVWGGYNGEYLGSGGAYLAGADSDGDGVVDGQDCAPDDPGAHSIPAEVTGLLFGGDGETLTWDSAAPDAGEDTVHDVLRGAIGELPVGDAPSETCLAGGVAGTSATDAEVPSPTAGFWYLVRGRNVCEAGTYGYATDGNERISTRCP